MTEPSQEGSIASEVSVEVASIVSAAENAAAAIRQRAEHQAHVRRREADAEARRLLAQAAVDADELVVQRLRRISELSDSIVERAAVVADQLGEAEELRRQLNGLLKGLAKTAERVASELGTLEDDRAPEQKETGPAETAERVAEAEAPPSPATQPGPGVAEPPDAGISGAEQPREPARTEPARVVELHRPAPADAPPPTQETPATAPLGEADGARLVALQMAVAGSTRGEVAAHLRRTYDILDPHAILDDVFGDGDPNADRRP